MITKSVDIGGVRVGGEKFVIFAGPCSIESEEHIVSSARHLRELIPKDDPHLEVVLKAGAFKWRSKAGSFDGMGVQALEWAIKARELYAMPFVTEVTDPRQVEMVAGYADGLQLGEPNARNYALLQELGRVEHPVVYKRGRNLSVEDALQWAGQIEHGRSVQGNIIMTERGIDGPNGRTRAVLDYQVLNVGPMSTTYPWMGDATHPTGMRELVPYNVAAITLSSAHACLVEFHPDPRRAKSDGPSALDFEGMRETVSQVRRLIAEKVMLAESVGRMSRRLG